MNKNMKKIGFIVFICLLVWALPAFSLQAEKEYATGLVLATPDQLRGVPLAATPYAGEELPRAVDLSPDMPPPGQQGRQNSCVAWALAYALKSYQEKLEEKAPYIKGGTLDPSRLFSPAFIYNQCNQGRNSGVPYVQAFNVLSEQGAATLADMPYEASDFLTQPSDAVKTKARRYRIDYWRQVNIQDLKEVKAQLHAGYPVLIGAKVDEALKMIRSGEKWNSLGEMTGAHAMVVVGYDDDQRAFRLMNSWGTGWAENGFCWVDYDLFRRVVNEGYVVKDALNGPRPTETTPPRPIPPIIPPQATLAITNILHNTSIPNRPDLGYFMKFEGTLDIPAGLGQRDQVVVFISYNAGGQKGSAVQSLSPEYADVNGFAACGTGVYPVPPTGLRTTWQCWIPYTALNVPVGRWVTGPTGNVYQYAQTSLFAEALLFIDNFGVARTPLFAFLVNK